MADVSLMAVPSEHDAPTCTKCGAELVADQRYCLECGQPVSPVRLGFLDALQGEQARTSQAVLAPATIEMLPVGYGGEQGGLGGWLRRNSGVLGLLTVLLLCLIAGLLVGHWATQSPSASHGATVVKIEGGLTLPGATAATPAKNTTSSPASKASAANNTKKEEQEEAKEAAHETKAEKAPPAKPVTLSTKKLQKLSTSTGKKHVEEINALGDQPIETR